MPPSTLRSELIEGLTLFFDHGDGAVGHACALGEFTLGQALELADRLQSFTHVQCDIPQVLSGPVEMNAIMATAFNIYNASTDTRHTAA